MCKKKSQTWKIFTLEKKTLVSQDGSELKKQGHTQNFSSILRVEFF